MRFVKLGIISVIVIFIILTAMSSLLPSQILVSRAVDIKGSVDQVRQHFFLLQNWESWMTDAQGQKAVQTFSKAENSLVIGNTTISIVSTTDSTLSTNWTSPSNMTGLFRIINHHSPDSLITVQWQMEQDVKWYPWEKFASITKDEIWGGSMEKSLENLKLLVEAQ